MSRFDVDYEPPEYNNADELWYANLSRALSGKRGKKAISELREALLALPEKRLIAHFLCTVGWLEKAAAMPDEVPRWDGQGTVPNFTKEEIRDSVGEQGEGVCVVGAYVWWKRVKAGVDPEQALVDLGRSHGPGDQDIYHTAFAGRDAGLTYTLAYELARLNDEAWSTRTPEGRYEAFMEWIDGQLGASA